MTAGICRPQSSMKIHQRSVMRVHLNPQQGILRKKKETMTIQIWLHSTHTYYIKYEANCENVHDVLNSMKNFQPEKKSTVIYCTYIWKNNAYLVFVLFFFLLLKQFKRFQNKFCSKSPYEKLIYLSETKWLICIITQKQTWRPCSC